MLAKALPRIWKNSITPKDSSVEAKVQLKSKARENLGFHRFLKENWSP